MNESWPYLDVPHKNESAYHLRLKNLAIYWLQQKGFTLSNIQNEYYLGEKFGKQGYTDIYAFDGSDEVFVECETNGAKVTELSRGGSIPGRDRRAVYYFDPDGIYSLKYREVTLHHTYRDESMQSIRPRLDYLGPLPILDLRNFEDGEQ